MDDQVLDLLTKRMDDHREETSRRFDDISDKLGQISREVSSLKEWKWTTKGKLLGASAVCGIIFSAVFHFFKDALK